MPTGPTPWSPPVVVDGALERRERAPSAAPAVLDDLRGDGDGGLLGGAGTDVEPQWRPEPGQLVLRDALLAQPF
jgi:hypothetical protein